MPSSRELWQEIAWDGVGLQLPRTWVPTIIHKSYLLFEENGQPAFAIKWDTVRGNFSAHRILDRLHNSVKRAAATLSPWEVPAELRKISGNHSVTGFQLQQDRDKSLGLLLFCPHCRRSTMLQMYGTDTYNRTTLQHILASFTDHPQGQEQNWFMYDIRARLPVQARLQSSEFLAGRYTLSFALPAADIHLYRFKPAAAILKNRSLEEFGASLAGNAVRVDKNSGMVARWEFSAAGLDRIAAMAGRKPRWIWLQLKFIEERNAILAVKGSGNRAMDRRLMEHIAENFIAIENL